MPPHTPNNYAFWLLVIAAFMTAFYSWRLMFMTFHGMRAGGTAPPSITRTTLTRSQRACTMTTLMPTITITNRTRARG